MEPPYIDSIEWSKWHVFWLDERVVPKDHEDSNYKLAYDGFLSKVGLIVESNNCCKMVHSDCAVLCGIFMLYFEYYVVCGKLL